ncbi:protein translocase subunit SecD [Salisediminibacterium selenitireducens]|uniref:Protein translocase subunit SecD n=1 Tax=Bacillus selenitireducens (strain ATCC 700615 / DSM 15326 / MLS10) TaxID=439292 RepID=D6XWY8_BACIE|nr:protein translocase subunit SecD [Salisediminibacterium selenitireducens]ADH99964.1 protein-export membrane protein SecD [[Bacillus] selenitireducens MLS10]
MKKRRGVKKGHLAAFFAIIISLGILIAATVMDHVDDIRLGLDLQGGFEVLYEVEPLDEETEITRGLLTDTVSALNARVDVLGVSEPSITIEGEDRIRVQLAGIEDQSSARELLSTEARLSFRDTENELLMDGGDLVEGGAQQTFDPETNRPIVQVTVDDPSMFGDITSEISQRQPPDNIMAIWMDYEEGDDYWEEMQKEDSKIVSAPRVQQRLNQSTVVITGDFTVDSAQDLAGILNAGALPVSLEEVYSNSVGASLGERAMDLAIFAGYIGVALIFGYMLLYYRFMGIIAVLTLSLYTYVVLVIFDWMNAVLTLPGIAALILGVGMAVDANIITFERIKDELRSGKSVMSAFKAGSRRSLSTIIDANVTTILAAVVLFYFGTSAVQGFALMLIVSILTSFLTAVLGARLFLGLWVNSRILNGKQKLFGVKEDQISEL